MDIKAELTAKVEEIVNKVKNDKGFADKFRKDPVKAVESVLGIDLPDDQINKLVDAVKAKVAIDDISDIAGKLGGIFGKK